MNESNSKETNPGTNVGLSVLRDTTSTQRKLQEKKLNFTRSTSITQEGTTERSSVAEIGGKNKLSEINGRLNQLEQTLQTQIETNQKLQTELADSKKLSDQLKTILGTQLIDIFILKNKIAEIEVTAANQAQNHLERIEQNTNSLQGNRKQTEKFAAMFKELAMVAINNGLEIKELLDSIANFQMFVHEAFELNKQDVAAHFPDNSREDKEEFLEYCQNNLAGFGINSSIEQFKEVIAQQYEPAIVGEPSDQEIIEL